VACAGVPYIRIVSSADNDLVIPVSLKS